MSVIVAAAVLMATCDDSPTTPSGLSKLTILLTDAPIDGLSQVNVFISGLMVKHVTLPVERIDFEGTLVDLLALNDTTQFLATAGVVPGVYAFIMVELDAARSNVVGTAGRQPVQIPSNKIKVLGGFEVPENVEVTVTLDFDASDSLIQLGNGRWLMSPVIVMEKMTTS